MYTYTKKLRNGKYIAIHSNSGAFKASTNFSCIFSIGRVMAIAWNNALRYRTRINFDFVRLESEFFQRHSHVLAQVSRVRTALKCYVGLVFVGSLVNSTINFV